MSKKLFLFLIIGLGIALLPFHQIMNSSKGVRAAEQDVTGWAWIGASCTEFGAGGCGATTEPIGWVSFNSSNQGASTDYGVIVDYDASPANTLQGEAWIGTGDSEENVGWLLFDENSVPSWEADSGNYARIDGNKIKGWAPIKTGGGTTLTWVKFKGSGYSNVITSDGTIGNSDSSHYAWAGRPENMNGGLGWIDMNPYRDDSNVSGDETPPLAEDETVQFPELNQDPTISNLEAEVYRSSYCAPQPAHTFSWEFSDDKSDDQAAYRLQVGSYDSGKVESSSNDQMQVKLNQFGKFNNPYTVKVTVYDDAGNTDSASTGFRTPDHRYPAPNFKPSTDSPEVETRVVFRDKSTCYSGSALDDPGQDCTALGNYINYKWDFNYKNNNFTLDSDYKGDASTTYSASTAGSGSEVKVNLRVQDTSLDNDPWCEKIKSLNAILPLPEWEEVGGQD